MGIVYGSIGWFVGLWLASLLPADRVTWLLVVGAGGLGVWAARQSQVRWLFLLLVGLGSGGARYVSAVPVVNEAHIAFYNDGEVVTFTGLVVDEPDVRDEYVNLRVEVFQITALDGTTHPVTGLVLVRAARFPLVGYGARVEVNGRLQTPPENPEFSYKDYLARQGIHSLVSRPTLTVLAENQGQPLYQTLFSFKNRTETFIQQLLPNPQAALLTGILLGNDNGMPPALNEAFRTTGLTHIIAISGFNVSLIVAVLAGLSAPIAGRRGSAVFAISGIILYTVLVGASASVVRAAIMGSLFLINNRWLGRPNFAYASLLVAGVGMTLVNPFTLWDVGFQLSFMATLGLMVYATPFTEWARARLLRWLEARTVNQIMGVLSDAILLTLAAQVLTLPLMMGYFQQVSLISLVANAFVLPAQPGVMLWGGLAVIAGYIAPAIGQVVAWVAWLFLTYTVTLVRLFATVPGAAVPVHISPAGVVVLYGLIAGFTWYARQEPAQRVAWRNRLGQRLNEKVMVSGSIVAAVLAVAWGVSLPDGKLHVAFLDVGQGDAIFIQTPSGRQILVDGGLYPTVLADQLGRQMPFWDNDLDMVVATHADEEHVAGLTAVFTRYTVSQLITNGEGRETAEAFAALLQAAENTLTPIHPALAGEVIMVEDGVRLEVLHPGPLLSAENRDDNSVVLRLVYGAFTLLLTGDAGQTAEEVMLANGRSVQAVVLKAGHHGAESSNTLPFLQAVQPHLLVISAGLGNRNDHPHPAVLERAAAVGTAVLRTDELGTIQVVSDGQTMWWEALK